MHCRFQIFLRGVLCVVRKSRGVLDFRVLNSYDQNFWSLIGVHEVPSCVYLWMKRKITNRRGITYFFNFISNFFFLDLNDSFLEFILNWKRINMKWIYNQLFGKWKRFKFNRQLLPEGDVLTWLGIEFLFARIDNSEYRERSWANWCCCSCCCFVVVAVVDWQGFCVEKTLTLQVPEVE